MAKQATAMSRESCARFRKRAGFWGFCDNTATRTMFVLLKENAEGKMCAAGRTNFRLPVRDGNLVLQGEARW